VEFEVADFNGGESYYSGGGMPEWADLEAVINEMPLFLQGSLQAGKVGSAIFDPKATNLHIKHASQARGWRTIPVPADLRAFGNEWDGGKRETLGEWQFSNYPFLWNNCIRSEAVYKAGISLPGLSAVRGLIVITKSGLFPASNSSLYYEQAKAQLAAATQFDAFSIPIRLVGLTISSNVDQAEAVWTEYTDRTSRTALRKAQITTRVTWRPKLRKYGNRSAVFTAF
jgi:hypothetical protein